MNKLRVAIPLKTNSSRVPMKNLRAFAGEKSLFDIKAEQLLTTFDPKDIYVSCEDPEVKKIVQNHGFNFLLRDPSLTPNSAPWCDVIKDIVTQMPSDGDIMWTQVTQPLFDEFSEVLKTWESKHKDHDSLAVVQKIRHHILDERGRPVNFNFGYWHKVSQELPPYYQLTWACFIMKREMLEQCWYNIGRSPYLFDTQAPLVDIDTEQEFETAQVLFEHFKNKSNPFSKVSVTNISVENPVSTARIVEQNN